MAKKTKTTNQQAYEKQMNRIKQAIKRLTKQGYTGIDETKIPAKPKRITQKFIETLKSIKPRNLLSKATYTDKQTGKTVSAREHREQVRREAGRQASRTRKERERKEQGIDYPTTPSYVEMVKLKITEMTPPQFYEKGHKGLQEYPIEVRKNALISILEDSYTYYGEEYNDYLAENMEAISTTIDALQFKASSSEEIDRTFADLGRLLNVTSLTPTQAESLSTMAELYGGVD